MKTIITNKIDGYDIIQALGEPVIDPVATRQAVNPQIDSTDEKKAVDNKAEEMRKISAARNGLILTAREHFRNGDKSKHAKVCYDIELRDEQLKQLQEEIIELCKILKKKTRELRTENVVYFEPKAGEVIISEKEAEKIENKLIETSENKAVLTVDLKEIQDKRGVKYIKDGKVCIVEKLGEEPDGPLQSEVSPEQFEKMRIDAMTTAEKQTEYEAIRSGLLSQAAQKRSEMEIEGDKKAFENSQKWYKEEQIKIQKKYGLS